MQKIPLKQFLNQNPNIQFVRFFYNIEMVYGTVYHYALYMQYNGDIKNTFNVVQILISNWNQMLFDHKYVLVGYDKICSTNDILKEEILEDVFVFYDITNSYFVEKL